MTNKVIGDTLKKLRINANMNQEQVSKILNIKRDTYASWEVGRSAPKYDILLKIAKLYNVSCEYLLTGNYDSGYIVNSNNGYNNNVYGDRYVNELSNFEKSIILKLRILNLEDKQKVADFIENLDIK